MTDELKTISSKQSKQFFIEVFKKIEEYAKKDISLLEKKEKKTAVDTFALNIIKGGDINKLLSLVNEVTDKEELAISFLCPAPAVLYNLEQLDYIKPKKQIASDYEKKTKELKKKKV